MIETVILDALVPSWWEIKVTVAASAFVIVAYWYFAYATGCRVGSDKDRSHVENSNCGDDVSKVSQILETLVFFLLQLEGLVYFNFMKKLKNTICNRLGN